MLHLLVVFIAGASSQNLDITSPPQYPWMPSIRELAEKAGLSTSNYLVTTEDGYMIWMFRIGNSTGPPVLVQHPWYTAADIWMASAPQGLVFMLAEEGYDVYLGNQRGNAFALNHRELDKSDPRFWDWSFHEGGYYDMPAMIDRILEIRQVEKVFYIGYSLGTTVFFVMCSTRPEYNDKIHAGIMLSPVAFGIPHPEKRGALKHFLKLADLILIVFHNLGYYNIGGRSLAFKKFLSAISNSSSPFLPLCLDIMDILFGDHRTNIDNNTLAYYANFVPAGSSLKTTQHLLQVQHGTSFNYFDYGPNENLLRYNSTQPPAYDVTRISSPVALFWGKNDYLISESAVKKLASLLPNLLLDRMIPDPEFNHADIILGLNAKEVLYNEVVKAASNKKHFGYCVEYCTFPAPGNCEVKQRRSEER